MVGRKPLKVDGLINPEGPTQTATRGLAKQVADQWRGFEARNQAKPAKPVSAARPPVTVNPDSSLDADIKRLRDNMTADDAGELHRLADGLSKTSSPGKAAADISRAIDKDGLKAITEFQAVRERLAEKGTPEQVRALDFSVMQKLSPKAQKQVRDAFAKKPATEDGGVGGLAATLIELAPGIGNIASAVNALKSGQSGIESLGKGDFKDAAGHAGSTLLEGVGMIPVIGSIAKGVAKGGKHLWKSKNGVEVSTNLAGKSARLVNKHLERFPDTVHDAIKNSGLKAPMVTHGKRNTVNIVSEGTFSDADSAFDTMAKKLKLDPKKATPLKDNLRGREIKFGNGITMQVRPNSGKSSGNSPTIEFKFNKTNSKNLSGKSSIKIRFGGN